MNRDEWLNRCANWKNSWPVYIENDHADDRHGLDIYQVLETISRNLDSSNLVMTDAGSPSYACPTNLKASVSGQFIFNPSQADMGWAIPASVGVALNAVDRTTAVIVGDGSFYSNMQELAVIKHHGLAIVIFVLNNDGYLSIRNTQSKYHGNRVWGVDSGTGLTFPPLEQVASTFGIDYQRITGARMLDEKCNDLMHTKTPILVEVMCKRNQEILPAQALKTSEDGSKLQAPLHDMYPFLSEEEMSREWPGY